MVEDGCTEGKIDFFKSLEQELSLWEKNYKKLRTFWLWGGFTPFDCLIASKNFFCDAFKVRLSFDLKTKKNSIMKI